MSYVFGQAVVLIVLAAATGSMGLALDPLIPGRGALGPHRTLVRVVLGVGGWVVVAFGLATIGVLNAGAVATMLVIVAVAGGIGWWRMRPDHTEMASARPMWPALGDLLATVAVAALVAPAVLLAIGPTVSWDADVYHLALPKLYLEHGGFTDQPMLVYAHWPQAIELLFALAMSLGSYVTAKLVHVLFGVAVLWAVATAARRVAGPAAGWLAMALVLVNDVVFFELRSAYVDLAYAFFLLAAVLLLDRACDAMSAASQDDGTHDDGRALLLAAGIAGGLMASVKITGLIGALAAATLCLPTLRRAGWPTVRRFALGYGLPVALLWMPWLIKSAIETGNPIYPLAWRWWGGDRWSVALGEQFSAWQQAIGMGREPIDYLLLPYRVFTQGGRGYGHFDGAISPIWLLMVPLSLLALRHRPLVRRALAVAGVYFVAWSFSSQQMRFLIPIVPLLALSAAIASADLIARARQPVRPLLGTTAVVAVLMLAATTHARVVITGYERLGLYQQADPASLRAAAVPEVFRWIDENLPAQASILMLNTNQGFFCPRRYTADSFFEASQIGDWLRDAQSTHDVRQRLHQAGIDHILWSAKNWGIAWPPALTALLGDPAWAEPVFRDDRGHTVLRLR